MSGRVVAMPRVETLHDEQMQEEEDVEGAGRVASAAIWPSPSFLRTKSFL
jgi:hypothetical protein